LALALNFNGKHQKMQLKNVICFGLAVSALSDSPMERCPYLEYFHI
jgi:hypothetical protein